MRARAAWAALIGVIAVLVLFSAFSGKSGASYPNDRFRPVEVAEACKSPLPETVVIGNNAPNKEMILQLVSEYGSDPVYRRGSWRQNDFSIKRLFSRECIVGIPHTVSAIPAHIFGRQASYVPESYRREHTVASILVSGKAGWLDADISALNNFGVSRLSDADPPSHDPKTDSRESQDPAKSNKPQREISNGIAVRLFPKPVLFALFCGAIGGCLIVAGIVMWAHIEERQNDKNPKRKGN